MKLPAWLDSIKTQVTLSAIAVFLLSLWILALLTTRMLERDITQLVTDAQTSMTNQMAAQLDRELGDRVRALERTAVLITPEMFQSPSDLQDYLDARFLLQEMFNVSVLALDGNGISIADAPYSADRIGFNYREFISAFAEALDNNQSVVGNPLIGRVSNAPLIPIAVPIRAPDGQVIGALGGAINLEKPNFFDDLTGLGYGQRGYYSIVSKDSRTVVTSSEPALIMYQLPGTGVDEAIDRAMAGEEGSFRYTTVFGIDSLATLKGLEAANWFVTVISPLEEAFQPVAIMQRRMLFNTLLVMLVVGFVIWWVLRRQLRPMLSTIHVLGKSSETGALPQAIPPTGKLEIDALIESFNQILQQLNIREQESRQFKTIADNAVYGMSIADMDGNLTYINRFFAQIHGYEPNELIGKPIATFHTQNQLARVSPTLEETHTKGYFSPREIWHVHRDGARFPMLMSGVLLRDAAGKPAYLAASAVDITERKQAENALRDSESFQHIVLESIPLPIFYKDASGRYTGFNKAFETFFGHSRANLIGRSVFDIHPPELARFYHEQDQLLLDQISTQTYEAQARNADGEHREVVFHKATLTNSAGHITGLVGTFVDITDRKRAEKEIHQLAYYDLLTGLPNRRLLQDRLGQAMAGSRRTGRHGALVFLDIDDFKLLNDTRGHDTGDRLLVEISQRISAGAREADTVARLGGDEFVVILEDLSTRAEEAALEVKRLAEEIRLALACAYTIDGGDYHCSASLGIALFDGTQAVETLLKQADLAMYRSKDGGKNTLRFFDPKMQETLDERAAVETDLRTAVSLDQLRLYFQPQIDQSGCIRGAEALLRWIHPERGLVAPDTFIPIAEATGQILIIGRWVLETACRQLATWSLQYPELDFVVAVNVSAREFRQAEFVDEVKAILDATQVDPFRLRLELTESIVIDDVAKTYEKMQALRELGVGFSLDDFGTGYSSLAYLTRLPLDTLKIDKSFVINLPDSHNDAVIAQTVISMARSLNLNVIAEGVETEAQREFLAGYQCHIYQGYLFSRPLPLDEFELLLQEQAGHPAASV